MRQRKGLWLIAPVFLVVFGFLVFPGIGRAADNVSLMAVDCVKCHEAPPADIAVSGGKHKSEVSCVDCHAGHRPATKNNIPKCSQCHEGKPHYGLKNCLACHKNPHMPLNVVLAAKTTEPCLTCHTEQDKQLKENKSKHSAQYCTTCHDVHRKVPECVKCHRPHSAEMAPGDCRKCHKAHKPKVIAFAAADVANKDCGACHKQALTLLSATSTKHKYVSCVKCHEGKHKTVPDCRQCHGDKHPASILKKFPKCGMCHSIAHDLNQWSEAAAPAKAKAAPAKGSKKR